MVDRRKEEEYGTESKERRSRDYDVREKEELDYIRETGLKNWILFKQPKNKASYSDRLNNLHNDDVAAKGLLG